MEEIYVNDTPIRTARNFEINNTKIEDIAIPQDVKAFDAKIIRNNETIKIDTGIVKDKNIETEKDDSNAKKSIIENRNIIISNTISKQKLTYGNGQVLEQNVYENANSKIRIEANGNELISDLNDCTKLYEKKQNSAGNIQIIYNFDDNNTHLINNIEVIANSNLNLTIKYNSNTNKQCFHNGIIKITVQNGAKVNVIIANFLNNLSNNFEAIDNTVKANSEINYTIIDIGARTSISNFYSNMIQQNAKTNLNSIYLGMEKQLKDINYIIHLKGRENFANMEVQGALKDSAKKKFKGTLDFKKGSKKSEGNENEYCMLLSDDAKALALPMLLCTEEDVKGNHSTASGKVDEKELFYIMSRGIDKKEAVKLMVRANFNKIINQIENDELRQEIIEKINKKL